MSFSKNIKSIDKKSILKFLKNFIIGSSIARKMFRLYFLILIIFACLLFLPISFNDFYTPEGVVFKNGGYLINIGNNPSFQNPAFDDIKKVFHLDFFDILFTSFSAFSDTGLVLAPTVVIFSTFGKVILMFLIQIGGFGIMFFIFLVWKVILRQDKISINQMLLAQAEKGTTKIGQTSKMLLSTSIAIIILQFFFGIFYSLWFMYVPAYTQLPAGAGTDFTINSDEKMYLYNNASASFLAGFFHSVSSINNAGFDIIGVNSLAPYRNGIHSIFLFVTMFQFVLGGIGFPIIYDILSRLKFKKKIKWIKNRKIYFYKIYSNKKHKISLLTKIALSTNLIMIAVSVSMLFIFECTPVGAGNNLLWTASSESFGSGAEGYYNKSVQIIFQALSTRSAGFATINNANLNESSQWFFSFLMFVGGAPSSTAGGIRTTTFAIIMISIFCRLIGKKQVHVFKRSITKDDIFQSFIILLTAVILVTVGGVIMTSTTSNFTTNNPFTVGIFQSASAFGTSGLSLMGDLENINWFGKLYLMFLMFIGQYGISSTLLALNRKRIKSNTFAYIEESIKLG